MNKKEAQAPNLADMFSKTPGHSTPVGSAPDGGIMSFWPGGSKAVQQTSGPVVNRPSGKSVLQMQQSLLNLYNEIEKTEALAAKTKQVEYAPAGGEKTVKDESGETSTYQPERETGYKTFLSFLNQYAPQGPGREHFEHGKPGSPEMRRFPGVKKPDEFYDRSKMKQFDLRNLLQSIPRVGKHVFGKETQPDGNWGPMTQVALENTYVFAKTMLDFTEGMEVEEKIFTNEDLTGFHNLILPKPETNEEKMSRAEQLLPILEKVKQLFNFFNSKFTEKGGKGWGDYTSQNKAFVDYKKQEDVAKTGLDLYIAKLDPDTVIGKVMSDTKGAGELTDITVADLQSANNFKKFIDEDRMTIDGHPVNINDPDQVARIFEYVKSMLVRPTTPQAAPVAEPGY